MISPFLFLVSEALAGKNFGCFKFMVGLVGGLPLARAEWDGKFPNQLWKIAAGGPRGKRKTREG